MVSEGDQAPDFEIPGTRQGTRDTYRLSDVVGDGGALLAFYPSDFSPLCTEQLCALRNVEWFEFQPNISVLGISQDSLYVHEAFADRHDIPFPLLSDTAATVSETYDIRYDDWEGQPGLPRRGFFLLDPNGVVRYRSVAADADEVPDLAPLLAAVRKLDTPRPA